MPSVTATIRTAGRFLVLYASDLMTTDRGELESLAGTGPGRPQV